MGTIASVRAMSPARRAGPEDTGEVLRLRQVMIDALRPPASRPTRRRGYARACMDELPAWFRERGAGQVMLTASPEAEPLYASLGFVPKPDPTLMPAL